MTNYFTTTYTDTQTIMDAVAIAGNGSSAYSDAFNIDGLDNCTVHISTTGTTPHLLITNEYSNSKTEPLDLDTFATVDSAGATDVFVDDYEQTVETADTLVLKKDVWARMKVSGIVGCGTNVTVTIVISKQNRRTT
jgi:hypothetical protein